MSIAEMPAPPPVDAGRSVNKRDPYRGVVAILLVGALLSTAGAIAGGLALTNPVLLDLAVALGISTGILIGVALAQSARAKRSKSLENALGPALADEAEAPARAGSLPVGDVSKVRFSWIRRARTRAWHSFRDLRWILIVRFGTAAAGVLAIGVELFGKLPALATFLAAYLPASLATYSATYLAPFLTPSPPTPLTAEIAAGVCLVAAGLTATAASYLADIDVIRFPEGPGLCRGGRVITWMFLLAAASVGLAWFGQQTALQVLHFAILAVDAGVCLSLFIAKQPKTETFDGFPLDFGLLSALGSRPNILASVLDTGERQLGIDLRSTWALTVVRRSIEPLLIGLCLLAWLSTSLTVVGVQEQGLIERLGVPVEGKPLSPGLHLHYPWPVDQVFRIPVQRVQALQVGHEGQAGEGPENVLWAVEHAPNEYTLLLGNGRDLVTVDAAVQYRIADARAWRYHTQNPADALRAIAYRAVMRSTVNRTLDQALSQNLITLTEQMRAMVQHDADVMGLGVDIVGFTVGGMHPPVPVAPDYEAVVSAELGKVTSVVDAQAYLNQTVPAAEASAITSENTARADGAQALSLAAGEAWSFRTLESQYRAAPGEYFFRRRLETLEKGLVGRRYTVIDSRFQRDGGELWLAQ